MKKALSIVFLCVFSSLVFAETVKLTSLDWPPYTSKSLKEQGASVAVAKAAFKAAGHDLVVEFFPWKRAVELAKSDPGYDGYFPEYYSEELKVDFILSDAMGSGPLGFAELKSNTINWGSLANLNKYKIGVVSGYVNTAEFDQMVADKKIKVSEANSDVKNLLKLSGGRVDLAIVDQNVLRFLMSSDADLKKVANKIQFNAQVLEDKQLYICFKKGGRGERLASEFNTGLTKINVPEIMKNYLESL